MTEARTIVLPGWMRIVAVGFALLFGFLTYWLTGRVDELGRPAGLGAVIAGILAVVLLVGAVRGELWKWVWFVPGW